MARIAKVRTLGGEYVTRIGRLTHYHPALGAESYDQPYSKLPPVPPVKANVVSSLLPNGKHAPAIDIDLPVIVVPSKTEGHFHLYIEHELEWPAYCRLLDVMAEVGIVEPGFVAAAKARGTTLLRKPVVE